MEKSEIDEQIVLNYTDKLCETLYRIWAILSWTFTTEVILSVTFLALSLGEISVADWKINFSGLNVEVSISVFLVLGTLIMQTLAMMFVSLEEHEGRIRSEIIRRYLALGYRGVAYQPTYSPFVNPSLHIVPLLNIFANEDPSSASKKIDALFSILLAAVLYVLLPFAAQIATEFRLLRISHGNVSSIIGEVVLVGITGWVTSKKVRSMTSEGRKRSAAMDARFYS